VRQRAGIASGAAEEDRLHPSGLQLRCGLMALAQKAHAEIDLTRQSRQDVQKVRRRPMNRPPGISQMVAHEEHAQHRASRGGQGEERCGRRPDRGSRALAVQRRDVPHHAPAIPKTYFESLSIRQFSDWIALLRVAALLLGALNSTTMPSNR